MSETQRYAKLRQAIGASDADVWVERGKKLLAIAKRASETAKGEVFAANTSIAGATRQLDEVRALIAPDDALSEVANTVADTLGIKRTSPDLLASQARRFIAKTEQELSTFVDMLDGWKQYENFATEKAALLENQEVLRNARIAGELALRDLGEEPKDTSSDLTISLVNRLHELRQIGEPVAPIEGHCPLCAAEHDENSFALGFQTAGEIIERLGIEASRQAEKLAEQKAAFRVAKEALIESQKAEDRVGSDLATKDRAFSSYLESFERLGFDPETPKLEVETVFDTKKRVLTKMREALSVLETVANNKQIELGNARLEDARKRLARAQEVAGRARRTETIAASLHDAARRAGSETLDLRLDRVLPLMAELYGRLRPHPVWQDIEYSIRGDLRRFLSLQVGDGLNPHFLFSSGQRRATGLAFLLSINLSLAWSKWKSVLLDDPVQHVDDFRTVNLAEVLAQLVKAGRQVIIAVEDPALAELLARRMPVLKAGDARRITLGIGQSGSSTVLVDECPQPMLEHVLAA